MELETQTIKLSTNGYCDIIDITNDVQDIIFKTGFTEGNALIFAGGSTGGITTIEYEPGLLKDYPQFFDRIAPGNITYEHDNTWHDGNGHSHVRAAIQGCSFTVPFKDKKLLLGTWQQIIFIDFDNRPRERNLTIQLMGKK
ncbi:MAG: secondary thiamine-phosphate synthase enzyme YjbQ [Ignavibacteria bacterium]|nr:secondary thiamine-phosphate synthase enzyme YjbQ [Ignavibacteria bacterium]MBT8381619.1 secondary thiamine-phosphate synthase enzyme YjbQ [Ignavibacteria bacterium]MBT8391602.1 secondary thiamine-phosphate synthase enzyme YjbQ [Ignavibacteria bacterium]NNJ53735.1 YjbQ family protein [Ignavibacteriaceae bacterium]NNL21532.1 YjbQ family protein [Ignavibacteriaceae bacterium]